jgi:putative endonuclease
MKYYLYILKSQSIDKYYTGSSDNPEKRLGFHNTIKKGFTSRYKPWEIVFKQEFESKGLALAAERKIKKWKSKKMIEKIIAGEIIL